LTAKELFARFRALSIYPGIIIENNEIFGDFRIIEASLENEQNLENSNIIFENISWLVTKENKKQQVFLRCKNQTLLGILAIKNNNGKLIKLENYQFKLN
jgi:hypothetical protein